MNAAKRRLAHTESRSVQRLGLAIFVLAFALRLLFCQATPDSDWVYSAFYKGDVPIWTQWSLAIVEGESFEQGIPFRPPGAAYLFAAFDLTADGAVARLRFFWCLLGAATVLLIFLAVNHGWRLEVATLTGLLCAGSTGLMVLSVSPNNETPYLFLVALIIYLWRSVDGEGARGKIMIWSGLHGLACLFRAEHLLFYGLLLAWLGWRMSMRTVPIEDIAGRLSVSVVVFGLVLLPWEVKVHKDLRAFNEGSATTHEATETALQQVEDAVQGISWTAAALGEIADFPASVRRPAAAFVAATLARRGERKVHAEDLGILDEAFGYRPEKVSEYAFVAIYGGLNFYLANNELADGGFNREPLNRMPKLTGGPSAYPPALLRGLPPRQLSLSYPPHLQAVNRGYRMGWQWIRTRPGEALRLLGRKMARFTAGLSLGLGGWNFPMGLDGQRQSVDMAVPAKGPGTQVWALTLFALGAWGLRQGAKNPAMVPWLLFLLFRISIALVFFGYARHGALAIPVLALLVASGPAGAWMRSRGRVLLIAGFLLLGAESLRFMAPPSVLIDGKTIGREDPFLSDDAPMRSISIEWPAQD